ncbi:MAG: hypothetical protein CL596_02795 [Alteromonas sp.]|nr:hypothetical protein [Alteromonas sp.]
MKLLQFVILSFFSVVICYAQQPILDSLLQKAFNSKDSASFYFSKAKPYLKSKADSANYLYFQFYKWDRDMKTDSTALVQEKLIKQLNSLDSLNRLRKVYERLHFQELRAGRYEDALTFAQQAVSTAERMKDTAMISLHTSDISIIYHDFEDYDKGVEYGKKAYRIMDQATHKQHRYLIYANNAIGINFDDWGKADSALYYHFQNVDLLKKVEDSLGFAFVYNNIGNTLLKQKDYTEAKKYIDRALAINKVTQRSYNLATNYTNLATIAYNLNSNEEAKDYFVLANQYANESESIEKIRDVVQQEAWFYKKIGDFKTALEKQEAFYTLRDSVFNEERAQLVAEMETKYETEKKERDLAETRASLAEKELEVERKNLWLYGSLALALVLALIGYLVYNQQRLKNNQLQRESELKTALARIETQNKLQEQRLRISRDLHDNIGSQLTFVTSSVENLKYGLDDTNLEVSKKLGSISEFTTHTIYELRDTIWAMNKEFISVEDLQSRISNFIEKAGSVRDEVRFSFEVSTAISKEMLLPSIQGMNVYRIIQEGVNNALKYAMAKTITVTLAEKDKDYQLAIVDDGQGFDTNVVEVGNGLQNIKKRARDLNGMATIESTKGKGTKIVVLFPKKY